MEFQVIEQKRRLFFFVVCSMLAASILFGAGFHAVVAATGALAIAMAILIFRPHQRDYVESIGAAMVAAAPLPLPLDLYPLVTSVLAVAIRFLAYSEFSTRLPLRLGLISERAALISATREEVWRAIVPSASHPEDYWSGKLLDFDRDPDDPETVYLKFIGYGNRIDEMTMTFLDRDEPSLARFWLEPARSIGDDDILVQLRITDMGEGEAIIESKLTQDAAPLRVALSHWFENDFGDHLDGFKQSQNAGKTGPIRRLLDPLFARFGRGAAAQET